MVYIYGLINPQTNEIRYIGKTQRKLSKRYSDHIHDKTQSYRGKWVRSIISSGFFPEMIVIDKVCRSEWEETEIFWIAYFKFIGAELANKALGGGGSAVGITRSEDTREKLSKALKGKKLSKETCAKFSLLRKGKDWSDKQKNNYNAKEQERMSRFETAVKMFEHGYTYKEISIEVKLSISYMTGRMKLIDNYKEVKKANSINRMKRPEIYAKYNPISKSLKTKARLTGVKLSDETKRKMSDSRKSKIRSLI